MPSRRWRARRGTGKARRWPRPSRRLSRLTRPAAAPSRPQAAPRAGFEAEVRAAIGRAKAYPEAARERGIAGAARLEVRVGRTGRLLEVKLLRSSGDPLLDAAGIEAARRATLPAAPDGLPGESFRIEVGVSFEAAGG